MTGNTSIRTPSWLTLPDGKPAAITHLYHGLSAITLFRKGDFLRVYGKMGVRAIGKFKKFNDFIAYFFAALWEEAFAHMIDNNSTILLGDMTFALKRYQIKPHLNPDLISNDFKLTVPTVKIRSKIYTVWVTKAILEKINTPGEYRDADTRVLRRADLTAAMVQRFPTLPKAKINQLMSFSVSMMRRLIKQQANPTMRYGNTLCVIGPMHPRFKASEGEVFYKVKQENQADKRLLELIKHVKRNYN